MAPVQAGSVQIRRPATTILRGHPQCSYNMRADPPARIVAVWLIAVSLFQRRRGRADFADIVLRRGDAELRVL